MSEEVWRPLGVDTEDEIAAYDALHPGVPEWMETTFWQWVGFATYTVENRTREVDGALLLRMGEVLQVSLPNMWGWGREAVVSRLRKLSVPPLQIADYLLAHGEDTFGDLHDRLDDTLAVCKSAWKVGVRSGKPGLVRRVPEGAQLAADVVIAGAGRAGVRLATAWELLYGLNPKPSEAYRYAILAVEDAAIPVVSPKNKRATMGTVIGQMDADGDWRLPMDREHPNAATSNVLVAMMRVMWEGQHDRHGGQPSAPGDVSYEEANVAVLLAVTLVGWFDAGLVARR